MTDQKPIESFHDAVLEFMRHPTEDAKKDHHRMLDFGIALGWDKPLVKYVVGDYARAALMVVDGR